MSVVSLTFALTFFSAISVASALTLSSPTATVSLDDRFPRPLTYTLTSTGETLHGSLGGHGFHLEIRANNGQIICTEQNIETSYTSSGTVMANFTVTAWCIVSSQARVTTELTLEGYVSLNGSDFTWTLTQVNTI